MHNLHEMASHYKSDIKVNSKMVNKKINANLQHHSSNSICQDACLDHS